MGERISRVAIKKKNLVIAITRPENKKEAGELRNRAKLGLRIGAKNGSGQVGITSKNRVVVRFP